MGQGLCWCKEYRIQSPHEGGGLRKEQGQQMKQEREQIICDQMSDLVTPYL